MYNYSQAIDLLNAGFTVKRDPWPYFWMMDEHYQLYEINTDYSEGGQQFTPTQEDIEATDWIALEEVPEGFVFKSQIPRQSPEERIAELEAQLKQVMEVLNAKS